MPQKSYKLFQDAAYEGQMGTTNIRVIRGAVENYIAETKLPYGRVVCRNSASDRNKVRLPNAATDLILGIAIATDMYGATIPSLIAEPTTNEPGYPANELPNVLTIGDFVGWAEGTVQAGEAALFRHTAAAPNNVIGRFANTAGTGLAAFPAGWTVKFLEGRTNAGLVWMSINLP